jgi:SulP family sulfate permease
MRPLRDLRPLLPSRNDYRQVKRTWQGDLPADVSVGIVALSLALAFGVSSGAGRKPA